MEMSREDKEQMEFIDKWVKERARKKMAKLEKRLRAYAKILFGEEVVIVYARKKQVKWIQHNEHPGNSTDKHPAI